MAPDQSPLDEAERVAAVSGRGAAGRGICALAARESRTSAASCSRPPLPARHRPRAQRHGFAADDGDARWSAPARTTRRRRRPSACAMRSAVAATWTAAGVPQLVRGPRRRGAPFRAGAGGGPAQLHCALVHGYALAIAGRLDDARGHATELQRLSMPGRYTRQLLALVDGLEGRQAAALEWHRSDQHRPPRSAPAVPSRGVLPRRRRARSADSNSSSGRISASIRTFLAHHCRFLDPVRHTPRFQALLAQAKDSGGGVRRERSGALARVTSSEF